jgi:nitrite reductase/ring-hydroxylating ferredoxin subunit
VGGAEAVTKLFELRDLSDRASVRFPLPPIRGRFGPLALEGFAYYASDGTVRAWVNLCPHRAQPLDLGDGRLFNSLGEIECAAHGARFEPSTGSCVAGPCPSASLQPVRIREQDGAVMLDDPMLGSG